MYSFERTSCGCNESNLFIAHIGSDSPCDLISSSFSNKQLSLHATKANIVANNTLWDGHVVEEDHMNDRQTRGIMEFNDFVANDESVEKVILPLRDGLTIIRIK